MLQPDLTVSPQFNIVTVATWFGLAGQFAFLIWAASRLNTTVGHIASRLAELVKHLEALADTVNGHGERIARIEGAEARERTS